MVEAPTGETDGRRGSFLVGAGILVSRDRRAGPRDRHLGVPRRQRHRRRVQGGAPDPQPPPEPARRGGAVGVVHPRVLPPPREGRGRGQPARRQDPRAAPGRDGGDRRRRHPVRPACSRRCSPRASAGRASSSPPPSCGSCSRASPSWCCPRSAPGPQQPPPVLPLLRLAGDVERQPRSRSWWPPASTAPPTWASPTRWRGASSSGAVLEVAIQVPAVRRLTRGAKIADRPQGPRRPGRHQALHARRHRPRRRAAPQLRRPLPGQPPRRRRACPR